MAASPFPKTDAPQAPSPTIVLRTLGGIDALIALGGSRIRSGDAAARSQAGQAGLDALGKLKLGLLGGSLDQAMLLRRKSVAADLRDGSEDEKCGGDVANFERADAEEQGSEVAFENRA